METILTDREVATVIDALAMTRDALRKQGLTGNDCQTALDKITGLVLPSTVGLRIEAVQA